MRYILRQDEPRKAGLSQPAVTGRNQKKCSFEAARWDSAALPACARKVGRGRGEAVPARRSTIAVSLYIAARWDTAPYLLLYPIRQTGE